MARSPSFANVGVNVNLGTPAEARPIDPASPMRVLVLGDFSGRADAKSPSSPFHAKAVLRVDRDNFESTLEKLKVTLSIPGGAQGEMVSLSITDMDHFHPDYLWKTLPIFQSWRELRSDLANPRTFDRAADRLRNILEPAKTATPTPAKPPAQPASPPPSEASGSLLDQLLAASDTTPIVSQTTAEDPLQEYIRQIVEPHLVPRIDKSEQSKLLALVDAAAAAHLRDILHHPTFRRTEAAWRSLYFLIRRLDTDKAIHLHLLDISRAELMADLVHSDDLTTAGLHEILVERANDRPWALLLGLYDFDASTPDVETLARISYLANLAGAPFLAEAKCSVLGCTSLSKQTNPREWQPLSEEHEANWNALRQWPTSQYLGLILPRWMVRLPYGKNTSTVESFAFEEWSDRSTPEDYLWGNPAVIAGYILAASFMRNGWGMRPGANLTIDGLPVHVYREDGETQARPCAEVLLVEKTVEKILDRGLMVLQSVRDQDQIRLVRFQAVSSPAAPLTARWNRG